MRQRLSFVMRTLAAAVLLTLVAAVPAMAQDALSKEARVRELLTLLKAGDMGVQVIDNLLDTMKQTMPAAPEEFWTSFREKIKPNDLVDMLVPIYAKHLELEDIDALIVFYNSPAGKRFMALQPVIIQESMAVGQKWGEEIARQAIQEMQKRLEDPNPRG